MAGSSAEDRTAADLRRLARGPPFSGEVVHRLHRALRRRRILEEEVPTLAQPRAGRRSRLEHRLGEWREIGQCRTLLAKARPKQPTRRELQWFASVDRRLLSAAEDLARSLTADAARVAEGFRARGSAPAREIVSPALDRSRRRVQAELAARRTGDGALGAHTLRKRLRRYRVLELCAEGDASRDGDATDALLSSLGRLHDVQRTLRRVRGLSRGREGKRWLRALRKRRAARRREIRRQIAALPVRRGDPRPDA
jgi:hypothetical protein